ncbi:MAG: glycogen debranching protein GlgX [Selenomonadaceae bacterium]|nr:glycogen debranching protein GlgX [Selenomonadaceae bacterium]
MRVDMMPMDTCQGFHIRPGFFLMPGTSLLPGGVNFSVYSKEAKSCELVLYHAGEKAPFAILPFGKKYRIGNVFSMFIFDLDYEDLEYGFRMDGEYDPEEGNLFDHTKSLLDPRALIVSGREVWGMRPDKTNPFQLRGKVGMEDFDWGYDLPLKTPHNDLIIYEAHIRGFTKDESSGVKYKGTYAGMREKIPYLKDLGVTAVELMPIFEFDEFDGLLDPRRDKDGNILYNYWGYNTVGFFAPKAGYAASGGQSLQMDEFKSLVKRFHENGIKVILDVVFNHTGEGNEEGPCISFKGLDNKTYYMLKPGGLYHNFSGCGNTMNCNHPVVRDMIRGCLRYWVCDYHVDGFRFDLASILGRSQEGEPLDNPPLLEELAHDPVLADAILIAEAWDAAGLYQVGTFPAYGRWAEWNGRYRDDMRRFLKGDDGYANIAAARIAGSEDIYNRHRRGDHASVNFITCHDGFTLWDLYSYNEKHNEANGWENTDGANDNYSWNCGVEGETEDEEIIALRKKLVKNAAAVLLLSRGIPMLLAGDEFCNTQYGNNNPYCQDNKISWLDWTLLEKNRDIYEFFRSMIAFRKDHPVLRNASKGVPEGFPPVSLHGVHAWQFDASHENRVVCVLFAGKLENGKDDFIYVGMNMHWEPHDIWLPDLPKGVHWRIVVDTSHAKQSFLKKKILADYGAPLTLEPRSIVICCGKA